MAISVGQLIDV